MRIGIHKIKSVFISWLLSYLVIILITIIIALFGYWVSIKVIQSETDRAHMESLNQVKQVVDSKLNDIQRISVEASLNERINNMVNLREPINLNNRIEMVKIINDIKTYKIADVFIDKFYIYFKANDFIISNDARYDTKDFYDVYYKNSEIDYSKWEKLLDDKHSLEYLQLNVKSKDQSNLNSIYFMQSLPMSKRNSNDATLVIQMNGIAIQQAIEGLKWVSQGTIVIEDKGNNIIATTKPISLPQSLNYDKLNKTQDIFNNKFNNDKVVVSYVKSDVTSWKYISVVPESIFSEKLKYVYNIFIICVILCFFNSSKI